MLDAPDLPPPPQSSANLGRLSSIQGSVSTIDMGEVLTSLSRTEAAHWMVQKERFDHGPFTDRELVQMILRGEVLHKHMLHNMDTGVRKKVKAWGDFDEYLQRYREEKKKQEEAAALERTKKAESRSAMFKWTVVLGVAGLIMLGGAAFFVSRQYLRRVDKFETPDDLIAALESGQIRLKTGGNLIDRNRAGHRGRSRGKGGQSRGGGGSGEFAPGMSYEEAMNVAVELGNLQDHGGQQQLTQEVIASVMDRNVRRFLPCVVGGSVKKVSMDLVIGGDGRVIGVSVAQGDAKLKQCVSSKIRGIKFPESSAPRTAASWYFELY
jgi:hypothetical protein